MVKQQLIISNLKKVLKTDMRQLMHFYMDLFPVWGSVKTLNYYNLTATLRGWVE